MRWTLLIQADGGDYYEGEDAALYRDDVQVWSGTSCDSVAGIVRAVVCEDDLTVLRACWPYLKNSHFAQNLSDQPDPQ